MTIKIRSRIPPDGSVGSDQLQDGAVTTPKLADEAVTPAKASDQVKSVLYVGDETPVSTSSTDYVSGGDEEKEFTLYKSTDIYNVSKVKVDAELRAATDTSTATLGVFVDGGASPVLELSAVGTAWTAVSGSFDASAWSSGTHVIDIRLKVSETTGTAYGRMVQVWVLPG